MNVKLTQMGSPERGFQVRLTHDKRTTFGSARDVDHQILGDDLVSPRHFELCLATNRVEIRDLKSEHGTFVDQRRITRQFLNGGEEISAGNSKWLFSFENEISDYRDIDGTIPYEVPDSDDAFLDLAKRVLRDAGYDLHAQIGRGSFGRVYVATKFEDLSTVAIKVLDRRPEPSPVLLAQFIREVKVMTELQHKHIVELLDAGKINDEVCWYAMECVPGGNLQQLVDREGPLEVGEASTVVCQLLEALEAAHNWRPPSGPFVHRDVKPSNVMIDDSGDQRLAKLGDFGMAKNYDRAGQSRLTKTGDLRGTLYYMSKEQLLNSKYIGPEGDIFSTGAVLYFALTGNMLYDVPNDIKESELVDVILAEKIIPIRQRNPNLSVRIEDVFRRAVGLDRLGQFHTAREFRVALQEFTQ